MNDQTNTTREAELREQIRLLELAEEGAKEAFGVVVQQKRDLEAEVKKLQGLLAAAYKMVPQQGFFTSKDSKGKS